LDIKPHEHVRLDRGFDIPNRTIQVSDAVRLGLRAAWRRPFAHFPRVGIEPPEIAARVIRVPDDVVRADGNPSRPALGIWQHIFLDRERVWIDLDDLVGAKVANKGNGFRAHDDTVRVRAFRWRLDDLDFTGLGIETSDDIGV